jgi:hypothetical protein
VSSTPSLSRLERLVVVAGHAVYFGKHRGQATEESAWFLQSFQKGDAAYYLQHVEYGVRLAARQPGSLLVFSGGATRPEPGPISEAEGYLALAAQFDWWRHPEVAERTVLENFARDSYENLLFGIARFREATGHYPKGLEMISWGFKRERFELHRKTIGWPEGDSRYCYHGINDPEDLAGAMRCEAQTFAAFQRDPWGVREPLRGKRVQRNPFNRAHPYAGSCPEIAALLEPQAEDGSRASGRLPWSVR